MLNTNILMKTNRHLRLSFLFLLAHGNGSELLIRNFIKNQLFKIVNTYIGDIYFVLNTTYNIFITLFFNKRNAYRRLNSIKRHQDYSVNKRHLVLEIVLIFREI